MIRKNQYASYVLPIISANTYGGMAPAGTVSLNLFANIKRRRAVAFFAMGKASAGIYDRGVDAKFAKGGGYVCIMWTGLPAGSAEDQVTVNVV